MKIYKKILVLLSCLCLCTPVHAENLDDTPTLQIIVTYSNGIEAQSGDTFTIKYRAVGSDKEATMQFDASTIVGKTGNLKLQQGDYEITDITYEGYNDQINTEGFAVSNTFSSSYDYSPMYLNVGATAGQQLLDEYDNVFAIKAGSFVTQLEDTGTTEKSEESEGLSATEGNEEPDKTKEEDKQDTKSSEEKKSTKETSKSKDESNGYHFSFGKLIPVAAIALIGGVTLLVLYKKGIIY